MPLPSQEFQFSYSGKIYTKKKKKKVRKQTNAGISASLHVLSNRMGRPPIAKEGNDIRNTLTIPSKTKE